MSSETPTRGLRGLPRIKTSLVNHGRSESIPLLARTPSSERHTVSKFIVPSIAAALVVTLVTLAATHHSSRLDSSLIPRDANDNRAALASMTHPIGPSGGKEEKEEEHPWRGRQQPTQPAVVAAAAAEKHATHAQAAAHKHDDDAKNAKMAKHAKVSSGAKAGKADDKSAAAAAGGSSESGKKGDSEEKAAAEDAAAAAKTVGEKREVMDEKLRDVGYAHKLAAAAAERVHSVATLAQSEDADSAAAEALAQALDQTQGGDDGDAAAAAADAATETAETAETDDSTAAPSPETVEALVKAETLVNMSEPLQNYSDMALAPAPPLITKDPGFVDAGWATDDYRTARVSTKDPGALNALDPIVSAPGPPSNKTNDPVMKHMLKRIEENKDVLAESSVDDDGAFNDTAFIDELVREDVVLAPDEEPEAARLTSGGNYLSGDFDPDEMARIVGDDSTMDADERNRTVPVLEGDDIEENVEEEVPLAKPFDEESAVGPAIEEEAEEEVSSVDEDGGEGSEAEAAPSPPPPRMPPAPEDSR